MKYFNHLCDSGDDPDIQDAINEFGHHGYYVFFRTLEILGRELDPARPGYICIPFEVFRKKFSKVSEKILKRILKHFQNSRRIFTKTFEKNSKTFIHVNCPKFRKLLSDNTRRKVKEYRKKTGSKTVSKRLKDKDKDKDKDKRLYSDTSDEVRLSLLLFGLIKMRNENHKKPNINTWAKNIDLMIRIDNRDPGEIEKVIRWCQGDDFWQNNILSTSKLRKQYDRLLMQMKKYQEKLNTDEYGFDPYDTKYYKDQVEKNKQAKAIVENTKSAADTDWRDDVAALGVNKDFQDIDWDSLTPDERKKKWQELKKKATRKHSV